MARAKETPIAPSPAVARAAFETDLAKLQGSGLLDDLVLERSGDLTLFIPLVGRKADGTEDNFLLRLQFGYYREWPPSAQFVNPNTRVFNPATDLRWLPRVEDTKGEIAVHAEHGNEHWRGQLICSSATLEFYLEHHEVQPGHVWDEARHTFAHTLEAIRRGLGPECYKGRHAA